MRVPPFDVSERVAADQKALKEMRTKAKRAKSMIGDDMFATLLSQVQQAPAGYPVIIARTEVRDGGQMRNMWDVVRSRMDAPGAMVVAGVNDGKPVLMAAGTDEAVAAGFNAGAIIKAMGPAIQGGGGGKPTMAQAGGWEPDIDEAWSRPQHDPVATRKGDYRRGVTLPRPLFALLGHTAAHCLRGWVSDNVSVPAASEKSKSACQTFRALYHFVRYVRLNR